LALAAHLHAEESLVPSLEGVAGAEAEGEGAVAVAAGIELGAVLQPADVVDLDDLAVRGLAAVTHPEVHILHAGGGDHLLAAGFGTALLLAGESDSARHA